jgi:thiol-disulfide isomerase/thioredoxin
MSPPQRVRAPELAGRGFVGGQPLSLASLRGRVVLLDFWTFCCVNCLHVLEELRALEQRYGDRLVVIGVHAPKFPNEASPAALAQAVERYGVEHPVLDDADLATWSAYGVRAWPTLVLIDPEGYVALQVSGEGRGAQVQAAVETLLATHSAAGTLREDPLPAAVAPPHALPPATALRFPGKLAYDELRGLVAVSDTGHHRIVLLRPDGRVVGTVGSGVPGQADGSLSTSSFRSPQGVCFWQDALWVADTGNHRLRRVDLDEATVGTAPTPVLRSPWDVTPYGNILLLAMAGTHQLWGYDPTTQRVGVVAGSGREGLADGELEHADLAQPSGLAPLGQLLGFVDAETSSLRALAPREGGGIGVTTMVGKGLFDFGDGDGAGLEAGLQHPLGLAAVDDGWIVADTYNHRLRRYRLTDGRLETLAGSDAGFGDGEGTDARFDEPSGVVRVGGALLVADTNNHVLRRVELETGTVSTLVLAGLERPGAPPRILAPATLAERSEVGLVVALEPPPGARIDPSAGSAPVRIRVTADPPDLLAGPAEHADRALPSRLVLRTAGTGSGTLRIDARAAVCDEHGDDGAACRLIEASWLIPAVLAPRGAGELRVA